MSILSQEGGSASRGWRQRPRLWGGISLLAGVFLALALPLLLLPLQVRAAVAPQGWSLTDSSGSGWGLSLFEQPDPAHPAGWRLRVNARSPGERLDHRRPLLLSDGLGGAWTLPNRSEELVPPGTASLPAASAQFDAGPLEPRPSAVLPLRLEVPTHEPKGSARIMLPPDGVRALHELPSPRVLPGDRGSGTIPL